MYDYVFVTHMKPKDKSKEYVWVLLNKTIVTSLSQTPPKKSGCPKLTQDMRSQTYLQLYRQRKFSNSASMASLALIKSENSTTETYYLLQLKGKSKYCIGPITTKANLCVTVERCASMSTVS